MHNLVTPPFEVIETYPRSQSVHIPTLRLRIKECDKRMSTEDPPTVERLIPIKEAVVSKLQSALNPRRKVTLRTERFEL